MRRLAVAIVALVVLAAPGVAHADRGWVQYRGAWIPWHTTVSKPDVRHVNAYVYYLKQRRRAIHRAHVKRDKHIRALEAAQSTTYVGTAPSGAGVWTCLANHEEGGHNTATHGYFGFMAPPPGGGSWLAWSWARQVAYAQTIDPRAGWPYTGRICGLW